MQSPILFQNIRTANESGEVAIGYAVVLIPEGFTLPAHQILNNAVHAGLRRSGITAKRCGNFFDAMFLVGVVTVAKETHQAAIDSLKRTLEELELIQSAIAVFAAGGPWLTVHGLGAGGNDFGELFLNPLLIEAAAAMLARRFGKQRQAMRQLLSDVAPAGTMIVNGNSAKAWSISGLPRPLQLELAAGAARENCGSVDLIPWTEIYVRGKNFSLV
jgi:hypothetical protein